MILFDVNVFVNAERPEQKDHAPAAMLLEQAVVGDEPHAVSEVVLSSYVRIATHRRAFENPTPLGQAIEFCERILARPNTRIVAPGRRHWDIFCRLCGEADATGDLVPDAYLAALAMESGCELVSFDRDFARFPGLRWRHPLDG